MLATEGRTAMSFLIQQINQNIIMWSSISFLHHLTSSCLIMGTFIAYPNTSLGIYWDEWGYFPLKWKLEGKICKAIYLEQKIGFVRDFFVGGGVWVFFKCGNTSFPYSQILLFQLVKQFYFYFLTLMYLVPPA